MSTNLRIKPKNGLLAIRNSNEEQKERQTDEKKTTQLNGMNRTQAEILCGYGAYDSRVLVILIPYVKHEHSFTLDAMTTTTIFFSRNTFSGSQRTATMIIRCEFVRCWTRSCWIGCSIDTVISDGAFVELNSERVNHLPFRTHTHTHRNEYMFFSFNFCLLSFSLLSVCVNGWGRPHQHPIKKPVWI